MNVKVALFYAKLFGLFPFCLRENGKVLVTVSKYGLALNLCSATYLIHQIGVLLFANDATFNSETNPTYSPMAALIKRAITAINSFLVLVIMCRRFINAKKEFPVFEELLKMHSGTDKSWCKRYNLVVTYLMIELCELLAEYGSIRKRNQLQIQAYNLSILMRIAFEIIILVMLITEALVYQFLNNLIRSISTMRKPLILHNLRLEYENLHKLREKMNTLYSSDLVLYLLSSLMLMLWVCFEMVNLFHDVGVQPKVWQLAVQCLRFARLFGGIWIIIWRWCKINVECTKTLEHIFEHDVSELSSQSIVQINLLLEEVQIRKKVFSANKFFDINMSLLYNVIGTLFTFLMIIVSSSLIQSTPTKPST